MLIEYRKEWEKQISKAEAMKARAVQASPGFQFGSGVECHNASRQAGGNGRLETGLFDTEG